VRLGGYVRISVYDKDTEHTEGVADSPARQERAIRQLVEGRGDDLVKVYRDLDISAYRDVVRPAFEELLEDLEAGLLDGVVCWKLDRLFRRFDDLQRVWKLVSEREIALLSVHDSIDTSTAAGVFTLRMMVGIAEMESANTSLRTRAAKEEAARNGRPHTGGPRPFGYTDHTRQHLHPAEAPAIRAAVDQLLAGETLGAVVKAVNEQGIRTPRGKTWRTGPFADMLASPGIAGIRVHRGSEYQGVWPAIVSRDEHERLVALRKDPARLWLHQGQPRKHLLAGLLYCGHDGCGMKLVTKPLRGVPRYKCPPAPYGRGCGKLSISGPQVERVVLERVWEALDSPELTKALRGRPEQKGLVRQLEEDEAMVQQLGRDYADRRLSRPAFLAAVERTEERIRATRARLARQHRSAVLAALPAGVEKVRQAWEAWDLDRRRALLDVLIVKITVMPAPLASKQGRAFDRSRVRITWRV
jgi:site-specific DNA recombinase